MKKTLLIILGVLVVLIIAGIVWYFTKDKPIACTEEAKLCSDGTYVSRTGKNCEFAECPVAINFSKTGELIDRNPLITDRESKSNEWYFSHTDLIPSGGEKLGISMLSFDENSICSNGEEKEVCRINKLNSGDEITIKGIQSDSGVILVRELIKLNE